MEVKLKIINPSPDKHILVNEDVRRGARLQLQADQQVVDKLVAEITQLKETIKSYHDTYVKGGNTGFKL